MAIGELVTRLTCDSSNFDNNIRRSQREVQEFRRRTEREASRVNSAFDNMGSAISRVSPQIGGLVSALGGIAPIAATAGAAFATFTNIVKNNEALMDSWEKKVTQAKGVLESLWTSLSQSNGFTIFNNNLSNTIKHLGDLADAYDAIGTLNGFSGLTSSKVDAAIAKYKEVNKDPNATKEQKAKARKDAEDAIEENYKVNQAKIAEYQKAYRNQMELAIDRTTEGSRISRKVARGIISSFATDIGTYNEVNSIKSLLKGKSAKELLYSDYFKRMTEKYGLNFKGLFDPSMFKTSKRYLEEYRDFFVHLAELTESGNIVQLQSFLKEENLIKVGNSMQRTAYLKQLVLDDSIDPASPGGGESIYTSKQEAPKERTLQDILDDLDKSLVWNKYLAQNLGEDITGANLSTLEKTANELKDLLKNTTDEEQRKKIISELKTINNIINKPKEVNKPKSNANFENIYGNEIGNLSLNNDAREQVLNSAKETKEWEIAFRDAYKGDKYLKVDLDDVVSVDTARKYNYDANEYFKDRLYGNIDDYNKKIVKSIFNAYKFSDYKFLNSEKRYKPASDPNNKISSFIPFGELSNLDIPIKYPEEFYYEREASTKFSSGVSSVVKKYTGFNTFRRDFAKNAYSEFDRLISEGNIITPNDVNKILYQVYLDTIKMYTDDTPDFFKNASDFYEFVNKKTNINFNDKETKSKVNLILGEKNKNELIYQELLNNVSVPKEAKAGFGNDLATINAKSRSIKDINFGTDYIIGFINELSKGNTYEKARLLSEIKNKLIERREALTGLVATTDIGEDRVKLENNYKNLRLIQLEREKRSNKGVLSEENQKEYEELKKETGNDFSGSTNTQLETYEESFTGDAEKLAKSIEEANSIREDLEGKINQTDDLGNRIQKEEGENNVLRERQKVLGKLSNDYLSVADSAYQIGAAFSTLDSKFGDVASVLLNVVGITAEAIGKLIGMATAEGVSNAFKLPWPQNLAAVATVVAAGASAAGQIAGLASKKYATGGIVSGPGTGISDSIPIRVSNGEMILNHRQQSNLFNLLDKGSSTEGKIEFKNKLVGSDIIGSATTYNKRRNLIL